MINRRQLFAAPFALGGLAGCAELDKLIGRLPEYAKDAQQIGDVLDKIAKDATAVALIPDKIKTTVLDGAARVKAAADALVAAVAGGSTVALNIIDNFATTLNTLAKAVGISGGAANTVGKIGTALQMALAILPTILGAVGLHFGRSAVDQGEVMAARAWLAAAARA